MEIIDISLNIKKNRKEKGLTVETLAIKSNVTKGYISQIENFRAMPSIAQLYKIAHALEIEPSVLLKQNHPDRPYVLTKRDKGEIIEREYPESGFVYKALARNKGLKVMEPFILDMPPHSSRKNVITHGQQFFFLLKGQMDFYLADEKICMGKGDSLYFEGNIPHHPENNTDENVLLLVIYSLYQK